MACKQHERSASVFVRASLCLSVRCILCMAILLLLGVVFVLIARINVAAAAVVCVVGLACTLAMLNHIAYQLCEVAIDEGSEVVMLARRTILFNRKVSERSWTDISDLRISVESLLLTTADGGGFVARYLVGAMKDGIEEAIAWDGVFRYTVDTLETIRNAWAYMRGDVHDGAYHIRPQYKDTISFTCGLFPFVGRVHGALKWGYIDEQYKVRIGPAFEDAGVFAEGLAPVRIGRRYGYIDTDGVVVIPFRFHWAGDFKRGMASVRLSKPDAFVVRYAMIDRRGRFVGREEREAVKREIERDVILRNWEKGAR